MRRQRTQRNRLKIQENIFRAQIRLRHPNVARFLHRQGVNSALLRNEFPVEEKMGTVNMWKNGWKWAVVVAGTWAMPAFAGGYCSDKDPCKAAGETCLGHYCVPTAKLCTSANSCATWEKCDFSCPTGVGGGGTTSTGGGTVSSDAISSSDGMSGGGGSVDAGSSGGGSADASFAPGDGGSSIPAMPDADSQPNPKDAGPPNPGDAGPPQPIDDPACPKSPGVCVAVLDKVPAQSGCEALCKVLVPCNLSFGGGSSGGSSGGGGAPSADAGSTDPAEPDGASGKMDVPFPQYDASVPPDFDGGGAPMDVTPGPDEVNMCVSMCSIWKLDAVAPTELGAFESCVAGAAATGCSAIESQCKTTAEAFIKAAEANDFWSLGLGFADSTTTGSSEGGSTKDGDASPVFGNSDTASGGGTNGGDASGAPLDLDASSSSDGIQADGGASSSSGNDTGSAKSGCTAGTSASTPWGLAFLGLFVSALIFRRRSVG